MLIALGLTCDLVNMAGSLLIWLKKHDATIKEQSTRKTYNLAADKGYEELHRSNCESLTQVCINAC